jgi:hypothetical protein
MLGYVWEHCGGGCHMHACCTCVLGPFVSCRGHCYAFGRQLELMHFCCACVNAAPVTLVVCARLQQLWSQGPEVCLVLQRGAVVMRALPSGRASVSRCFVVSVRRSQRTLSLGTVALGVHGV